MWPNCHLITKFKRSRRATRKKNDIITFNIQLPYPEDFPFELIRSTYGKQTVPQGSLTVTLPSFRHQSERPIK